MLSTVILLASISLPVGLLLRVHLLSMHRPATSTTVLRLLAREHSPTVRRSLLTGCRCSSPRPPSSAWAHGSEEAIRSDLQQPVRSSSDLRDPASLWWLLWPIRGSFRWRGLSWACGRSSAQTSRRIRRCKRLRAGSPMWGNKNEVSKK